MQFSKLFQRGNIGTMGTRNRIVVSPINTGFADGWQDKWWLNEQHRKLMTSWAKGGAGLIIQAHLKVESEIDKEGAISRYMVLDRDDWINGLYLLTDSVHEFGTKIVAQLSAGVGAVQWIRPVERQAVGDRDG